MSNITIVNVDANVKAKLIMKNKLKDKTTTADLNPTLIM